VPLDMQQTVPLDTVNLSGLSVKEKSRTLGAKTTNMGLGSCLALDHEQTLKNQTYHSTDKTWRPNRALDAQPPITDLNKKIPTSDTYREEKFQSFYVPEKFRDLKDDEGNPRSMSQEEEAEWRSELIEGLKARGLTKEAAGIKAGTVAGNELPFYEGLLQPVGKSKDPDLAELDVLGGDGRVRCIVPGLLYIAPLKVARRLESVQSSGISHIVNLTGFRELEEQPEATAGAIKTLPAVSDEPEFPNPFPDVFKEEDQQYLHVCRPPDSIFNETMCSLTIDDDTQILSYTTPVNTFINNARRTKGFGGVLVHDVDSLSKAPMVCMAYLIQFEMKPYPEAYAMVMGSMITAQPHRSWMRQLNKLSEQNHGAGKTIKNRKKAIKDGSWGAPWKPETEDFVGVEVPTAENPGYLRIQAFYEVDGLEEQETPPKAEKPKKGSKKKK